MKSKVILILVVTILGGGSARAQSVLSYAAVEESGARGEPDRKDSSEKSAAVRRNDQSGSRKTDGVPDFPDDRDENESRSIIRGNGPEFYVPARGRPFDQEGPGRSDAHENNGRGNHEHGSHGHDHFPADCVPIPEPSTYSGWLGLMALGLAVRKRIQTGFRFAAVTRADTGS